MADYTLATAIGANDTSIKLVTSYALTGSGYPGRLSCEDEILYVTGGADTSMISVLRGQDGSDRAAHVIGTAIADANLGTGGATPTLAEVLAAGNETGGTQISGGDSGGSAGAALAMSDPASVDNGGSMVLAGGLSARGFNGGRIALSGGQADDSAKAGSVTVRSGAAAALGFDPGEGGDIVFELGVGQNGGRNGLVFFLNLPTADPLVAGALWANLGIVIVSAG